MRIDEMFQELSHAREEVRPSKYWIELNKKNVEQLEKEGYENFKRTIVQNYFTWTAGARDPMIRSQYMYLREKLNAPNLIAVSSYTLLTGLRRGMRWRQDLNYSLLSRLLWSYVLDIDTTGQAMTLVEPLEGNPIAVNYNGKLISQDLGNSFLEYQAIMDSGISTNPITTVMELGAGYGRTGYVFLKLNPHIRYIIADIPPALYVAERYLSGQFPDRSIFKFRPFIKYSDIAEEFERSQIAFLLPHQIEMLPDKSIDLFINISSLHEMLPVQVNHYINQVNRLTQGYFYMKQWKKWFNAADQVEITEASYPVPDNWVKLFWRECRVQTLFFESLFSI